MEEPVVGLVYERDDKSRRDRAKTTAEDIFYECHSNI